MSNLDHTRKMVLLKVGAVACLLAYPIFAQQPSHSTEAQSVKEAPPTELAPPPSGYPVNEVVMSTTDANNRTVLMRRGYWDANQPNGGFGYDKLYHKHNIKNKNAVKFVVRNPNGGTAQNGSTRRVYNAWAHRIKCYVGIFCRVVDRREVKVAVDSRYDHHAKGQKGVITGYCENPDRALRCPDWVDQSLNVQTLQGGKQAAEGLTLSYTAREVNSQLTPQQAQQEAVPHE